MHLVFFGKSGVTLCFSTKLDDMKECDAPESKSTVAKTALTKNSPSTTP
jgi:hypothetical protein